MVLYRETEATEATPEKFEAGQTLQEVVDRHYRPLRKFAISLIRCAAKADDLTQETILIYVRRGHQIRQRERVRQWLFTTLHREFLREVRRQGRNFPIEDDGAYVSIPAAVEDLALCEPGQVRGALAQLPERWRRILELRYFGPHSYQELAETLAIPLGTVMSRLSRAHKALRRVLEREAGNA